MTFETFFSLILPFAHLGTVLSSKLNKQKLRIVSACAISVTSQTESALVKFGDAGWPPSCQAVRIGCSEVGHFNNMLSTSAQCL